MEATGVYLKPVWHVLEGHATLVLANAMHIRNIPGRKSATNDATWISDLLALIRGSFVPPAPIAGDGEGQLDFSVACQPRQGSLQTKSVGWFDLHEANRVSQLAPLIEGDGLDANRLF